MAPRGRKGQEPKKNGVADLMKQLWEAAVNLRGMIEPADYKRYVLPIIFLRFLSMRYEKRRAELVEMVCEPTSEYFVNTPEERDAVLNDPDEYAALGTFVVPEEARWSTIVQRAQQDDIKNYLDDVLDLLERTYPDKLRGLLPRIYVQSNLDAS